MNVLWFAQNFQSAALLPMVDSGAGVLPQMEPLRLDLSRRIHGALRHAHRRHADHTTSPWGRRRPWIALGVALLLVGTWLLAIADRALTSLVCSIFAARRQHGDRGLSGPDCAQPRATGTARPVVVAFLAAVTNLGNAGGLALAAYLLGDVSTEQLADGVGALSLLVIGAGAAAACWLRPSTQLGAPCLAGSHPGACAASAGSF